MRGTIHILGAALAVALFLPGGSGCRGSSAATRTVITVDGSSTVFPITRHAAEEFEQRSGGRVVIRVSGTGGGFQRFCRGEAAIAGASRPIFATEATLCDDHLVSYIELPVAYDGIVVVVNQTNYWAHSITAAELAHLWAAESEGKLVMWSQVRAGWPDLPIHLVGPGFASGTFDYFTAAITGTPRAARSDFFSSEDDEVLARAVGGDPLALGFFGYGYVRRFGKDLRPLPVDDGNAKNGDGPVAPTAQTIADGTYQPLSRPVFLYVNSRDAERPEVTSFVTFYLEQGARLVSEADYVPLPLPAYQAVLDRFRRRTTGASSDGPRVGVTVDQLLSSPQ